MGIKAVIKKVLPGRIKGGYKRILKSVFIAVNEQ